MVRIYWFITFITLLLIALAVYFSWDFPLFFFWPGSVFFGPCWDATIFILVTAICGVIILLWRIFVICSNISDLKFVNILLPIMSKNGPLTGKSVIWFIAGHKILPILCRLVPRSIYWETDI